MNELSNSINAGRLLIAEPFLQDLKFFRAIVLLCSHEEEGSIGFIINKPLDALLAQVLDIDTTLEIPLYSGGPVEENTLHYIHRMPGLKGAQSLGNGLFWAGDFEEVKKMLEENTLPVDDFKFFIGYSGWGEGQLTEEMEQKSWVITDSKPELIFDTNEEDLWKEVVKSMEGPVKKWIHSPLSPSYN